jgi:hypothetical protein
MPLTPEEKEEMRAELAEARRILREDRVLAHNKLMDERWTRVHGADPAPTEPSDPNVPSPPDKKVENPNDPKEKSKHGWWGDALDD